MVDDARGHVTVLLPSIVLMLQLRKEHQEVMAMHGNGLSPASVVDMPYTQAINKEILRLAQVGLGLLKVAQSLAVPPARLPGSQVALHEALAARSWREQCCWQSMPTLLSCQARNLVRLA